VKFRLEPGEEANAVKVMTPEDPEPAAVDFRQQGQVVTWTIPRLSAYAVSVLEVP
jgi:hypothetical protein